MVDVITAWGDIGDLVLTVTHGPWCWGFYDARQRCWVERLYDEQDRLMVERIEGRITFERPEDA